MSRDIDVEFRSCNIGTASIPDVDYIGTGGTNTGPITRLQLTTLKDIAATGNRVDDITGPTLSSGSTFWLEQSASGLITTSSQIQITFTTSNLVSSNRTVTFEMDMADPTIWNVLLANYPTFQPIWTNSSYAVGGFGNGYLKEEYSIALMAKDGNNATTPPVNDPIPGIVNFTALCPVHQEWYVDYSPDQIRRLKMRLQIFIPTTYFMQNNVENAFKAAPSGAYLAATTLQQLTDPFTQ